MQSQDVTLFPTLSKRESSHKLQQGDFPELYSIVGEDTATHENLMSTGQNFFAALYGQQNCSSINTARYMIYTKKKGKPPFVKSLPPTDKNLLLHLLWAHCQSLLWEAADKQNATSLCITEFGWEWLNNVPSHVIASGPPAPPDLMKSVSCQCRAAGKACSEANCSCLTASLSCTTYCQCDYQWCRRGTHWFWHWSPWILDTMFDTNLHNNIASYMQTDGL